MSLDSMKEIFDRMEAEHKPFWEIVLETDMDERQVTRQQSMAKMLTTWQYMVDAADTYTGRRRSVSGLAGGDGLKMRQYSIRGRAMSGGYVSEVIAEALSMAESNACMRRIVAAPTAGACGVLPAVLLPLCKYGYWRPCMWPAESARSSPIRPASPAPPAAARRRSALPPLWRRGPWSPCGTAPDNRSATPWPWP